jgi:hypothetical protein
MMAALVLAVNPVLAGWGQFAIIVIGFYALIFIIIAVAFNLAMVFALSFLRQKAELVKKLRPSVESVNETTEAALQGVPPSEDAGRIARVAASIPRGVSGVDKQVEKATGQVASAVIEARARTMQAQAIVKAFLRPPTRAPRQLTGPVAVDEKGLEFKSPGYRMLMERKASAEPGTATSSTRLSEGYEPVPTSNGRAASEVPSQYNDVSSR